MSDKKPPIHSVRVGNIKASIWENQSTSGKKFFSTTLVRAYKDEQEQWHESSVFFTDDLPKIKLASKKAFEFIYSHAAERQQEPVENQPPASHAEKVTTERSGRKSASKQATESQHVPG